MMETNAAREPALLEVKVNMNWENYKKYYWFTAVRTPLFWFLRLIPLLQVLLLLPLLFALPSFLTHRFSGTDLFTAEMRPYLILIGLSLLIPSRRFLPAYITIPPQLIQGSRRTYRQLPKLTTESDLIYAFYRDDFQITHINQLATGIQTLRYEYLETAYETKSAFYLQPADKNSDAHILDKQYFTIEQMEALRKLFAEKIGKSSRA